MAKEIKEPKVIITLLPSGRIKQGVVFKNGAESFVRGGRLLNWSSTLMLEAKRVVSRKIQERKRLAKIEKDEALAKKAKEDEEIRIELEAAEKKKALKAAKDLIASEEKNSVSTTSASAATKKEN